MIKLFNNYPGSEELESIMEELGQECKPLRLMLTTVDCVEIYRVFFNRYNPPKGTWFDIDDIGNIWISSKQEGRHYDVIPHGEVATLLKEKSPLENFIDYMGVNSKAFGHYLMVVSLPTDEDHEQALSCTYAWEAASKLRASTDRETFVETIRYEPMRLMSLSPPSGGGR